ncbi:hypothetical protein [Nocardia australiensis]|uniref:hypothetical protein n=1 Tax=Nocardia australiensis TaxID=2887191 RepID=UPI001D13AC1E|nr:hypothetical protein [Nocardia australiensis]
MSANHPDFRLNWGYLCAAGLSILTLVLLFQPWLSASGPTGNASSNAFGRIDGIGGGGGGPKAENWDAHGFREVGISGVWAILASAAAIITVLAGVMCFRVRSETLACVVIGSSFAAAIFVFIAVLYLNSKAPALLSLTESPGDSGLRGVVDMLLGNDKKPDSGAGQEHIASASLDHGAMLGAVTALGAAFAAAVSGLRGPIGDSMRLDVAAEVSEPNAPAADDLSRPIEPIHSPRAEAPPAIADNNALLWERLLSDNEPIVRNTQDRSRNAASVEGTSNPEMTALFDKMLVG